MYNNEVNETGLHAADQAGGFFQCPLWGVTRPHEAQKEYYAATESHIFGYVTAGCGYIEAAGERYTVAAGHFFFIKKGMGVYLYPDGENPWERLWVHASGGLTEDLLRTFRLNDVTVAEKNVRSHFLELHDALAAMKDGEAAEGLRRGACLLFALLTEVRREALFAAGEQKRSVAEEIKGYIDNNLYNDISLDTVAAEFGISKMHVIRLFKKAFAMTPMQYQIERRVSVAKSLLAGTVMPIREISDLLRYANTQHFSNTFKNAVGVSPNKYRQAKQGGEEAVAVLANSPVKMGRKGLFLQIPKEFDADTSATDVSVTDVSATDVSATDV